MLDFTNEQLISLIELRKKHWSEERKKGNRDVCLIASICDAEDDIKTLKRALRIKEQYQRLLSVSEVKNA